jgi:hypothetical protein
MTKLRPERLAQGAAALGALGCAAGALVDPRALLAVYLPAAVAAIAIPSGALGVLMLSALVRRSWTAEMHRPLAAAALTLPAAGVLLVPILIGLPWLYPWATAAPEAAFKATYLAPWFFVLRSIGYIAIWTLLALSMQRAFGDAAAMQRAAAVGLIVFALTGSLAGVDWLESVKPEFHSSIYGFLFLTFQFVAGYAFGLLALLAGPAPLPPREQRAGYGAVLVATLLLWAYNHAMQYIIVWAGNMPDEMHWYVSRIDDGWGWALWGLVLAQFVVPFLVLLSAETRASARALAAIAAATLILRFVEAFVLVLPDLPARGAVLALDIPATMLLAGGLWLIALAYAWERVPTLRDAAPA